MAGTDRTHPAPMAESLLKAGGRPPLASAAARAKAEPLTSGSSRARVGKLHCSRAQAGPGSHKTCGVRLRLHDSLSKRGG